MFEEIIQRAPVDKIVVVGGGFLLEGDFKCNDSSVDIAQPKCVHKEGDTRIIIHCASSESEMLVVSARDTDVLLLLLAHVDSIKSPNIWIKAGTHKIPMCIPIRQITMARGLEPQTRKLLLPYQALTGSNTTSVMYGHGKKTTLDVFYKENDSGCILQD